MKNISNSNFLIFIVFTSSLIQIQGFIKKEIEHVSLLEPTKTKTNDLLSFFGESDKNPEQISKKNKNEYISDNNEKSKSDLKIETLSKSIDITKERIKKENNKETLNTISDFFAPKSKEPEKNYKYSKDDNNDKYKIFFDINKEKEKTNTKSIIDIAREKVNEKQNEQKKALYEKTKPKYKDLDPDNRIEEILNRHKENISQKNENSDFIKSDNTNIEENNNVFKTKLIQVDNMEQKKPEIKIENKDLFTISNPIENKKDIIKNILNFESKSSNSEENEKLSVNEKIKGKTTKEILKDLEHDSKNEKTLSEIENIPIKNLESSQNNLKIDSEEKKIKEDEILDFLKKQHDKFHKKEIEKNTSELQIPNKTINETIYGSKQDNKIEIKKENIKNLTDDLLLKKSMSLSSEIAKKISSLKIGMKLPEIKNETETVNLLEINEKKDEKIETDDILKIKKKEIQMEVKETEIPIKDFEIKRKENNLEVKEKEKITSIKIEEKNKDIDEVDLKNQIKGNIIETIEKTDEFKIIEKNNGFLSANLKNDENSDKPKKINIISNLNQMKQNDAELIKGLDPKIVFETKKSSDESLEKIENPNIQEKDDIIYSNSINLKNTSELLKLEVANKVQNRAKQIVNQYGELCIDSDDESLKASCSLCKTDVAYLLNTENWFKLGLAHNNFAQKKIYSNLIEKITSLLPNTNFYIAFSDDSFCLASNKIYGNITLSTLIKEFTYKELNQWELNFPLFKLDNSLLGTFFKVRYVIEKEKQYYDNFLFSYKTNSQYELNLNTLLTAQNIIFSDIDGKVTIYGTLSVNNSMTTHFNLNYLIINRDPEWITISLIEKYEKYSLENFLINFFGRSPTEKLIDNLKLARGISNLERLHINSVILNLQIIENTHVLSLIDILLSYVPNFSISPEFSLYNCKANYKIFTDKSSPFISSKLLIDCNCHGLDNYIRAFILKENEFEKIFLNSTINNISINYIKDKIFQKGFEGKQLLGLFPNENENYSIDEKLNFNDALIDEFSTEITYIPTQLYVVRGKIYIPKLDLIGNMNVILTNIGGKLTSFAVFDIKKMGLANLFRKIISDIEEKNLEEIERKLELKNTFIISSNEDIDVRNLNSLSYLFNNYNESYWNKGVHILYQFQIKENCEENIFCQYMNNIYGNDNFYYLRGEIDLKNKKCLLKGSLFDNVLAKPFMFNNVFINLNVDFTQNNKDLEFYLEGDYVLNVENNKSINFNGKLSFTDKQIVLKGNSKNIWFSAISLKNLNLTQIYMKGFIDSNYKVISFEISSLATIGENCFIDTLKGEIFQKDKCFYGNADVKINYENSNQNYLQGYFKNLTTFNILSNTLKFKNGAIYDNITKQIVEIKFLKGAEISYAVENIYKMNENKNIDVPSGVTIKGEAEMMGLNGLILLNIEPTKNELYGIFHFNTVTFAGGNAMIFETDYLNSNNIVFLSNSQIELNQQISFQGTIGLFGIRQPVNFSITNNGYSFKMLGKIFNSQYDFSLDVDAPYSDKLSNAPFSVRGTFFEPFLTSIEKKLLQKTTDWIYYIKDVLLKFEEKIKDLEEIVSSKRTELCDEDLCPKTMECQDEPRQKCVKYREKHVCKNQESYCLKPEQKCTQESKICVSENEICLNLATSLDENGKIKCLEIKKECIDYVTICSEWRHICNSDTIMTCTDYVDVIDNNICLQTSFVCSVVEVNDKTCQFECVSRKENLSKYLDIYYGLVKAKENLDVKLVGFWTLYDEIMRNSINFLKVISGKFQQRLDKIIEPTEIIVEIAINSFSNLQLENNFDVVQIKNFDFKNEENLINECFVKLAQRWSLRFAFDPVILKENEAHLINELYGQLKMKDPILAG